MRIIPPNKLLCSKEALVYKIISAAIFLLSTSTFACDEQTPALSKFIESDKFEITGPFTVSALEKENMIEIRETGEVLAFGYAYERWVEFKAQIIEGDEIYFFINKEPGFYQDGHFLVRNGCTIDLFNGRIS